MQITIADPVSQTYIFIVVLLAALVISVRKRISVGSLTIETTQELKGFAILTVLFSHIGYYLAIDHRFLFPLSVLGGVGVDLFLFMSGFGLVMSAFSHDLSVWQFYRHRLKKIYVPLWITLSCFFILDYFLLHINYGLSYITRSMLGWFPHANIYTDVNSSLWYISLIVFYYLLFPLIFSKRHPFVSALGICAVTCATLIWASPVLGEVVHLYLLHSVAFPLGIAAAALIRGRDSLGVIKNNYLYYTIVAALLGAIGYLAIYSNVGAGYLLAESTSIVTMLLIVVLFVVKRTELRLLYLFGLLSFELYLVHWPLMYRYDVFFKWLPAWMAVAAYLVLFLGVGKVLQILMKKIDTVI